MSDTAIVLKDADLRRLLAERVAQHGSQAAFGRRYGFSQSQVSEALSGHRPLTQSMVTALGFIAVTRYVPVKKGGGGTA